MTSEQNPPFDGDDPAFPAEKELCAEAAALLDGHFREVVQSIIDGLASVGHVLQQESSRSSEVLNAVYLSTSELSPGVRLAVGFDVTVSAFRFRESSLRPGGALPTAPSTTTDWSTFSLSKFRHDALAELGPRLQRAIEVEMRARLWQSAQAIARAKSTADDEFWFVNLSDDYMSQIDYCAFGRKIHLGFTFIGTVWNATE